MTGPVPIQFVKGVGPRLAEAFKARKIETVRDALFLFPNSYEDRRHLVPVSRLVPGTTVPVRGVVSDIRGAATPLFRRRGGKVLEVSLSDGRGVLVAKWFRFHPSLADRFKVGETVTFCGTVHQFLGRPEMHHPEILGGDAAADPLSFGRIVPVYPDVAGIPPRTLRKILWEIVSRHAHAESAEFLPRWLLDKAGVPPLEESLLHIHFPPNDADTAALSRFATPYQRRLVFGELFAIQWECVARRAGTMREAATPLPWDREIVDEIKTRLPFTLTGAQRRVVNEILKDMAEPHPMHRLLQGDVGSGKTIVAWIAAMVAWRNGAQAALMAPTEILAEQHFRRFSTLCEGLPVRVVLLTSAMKAKAKREAKAAIADGSAHLVVGTHAIIQEGVDFSKLALGIVDEQHRFGVLQRAALKGKAVQSPHLLVMTATPIPRTLAMTLYGDLDVSVVDEMPPGRTPVITKVVSSDKRGIVRETLRKELAAGGRIYIVLPLVEESEKLALRDAVRERERVAALFPDIGVGLLHGRMSGQEKDEAMRRFRTGEDAIMVSTTVIEVGVDVPEASVIVVEHAGRFGLSQLHQLRGRVGRGRRASFCFLMADGEGSEETVRRLSVMEETTDGFRIAEADLSIRGPGDFAGVRQSGLPDLVFSDIVRDASVLQVARSAADEMMARDPELSDPAHHSLKGWLLGRNTGPPSVG